MKRSTITIPPFSDELSIKIIEDKENIHKMKNASYFEEYLIDHFELKPKYPNSNYTADDVKRKILQMEKMKYGHMKN